ncbi:hypothetical protein BIW11_09156 [Tropilaelaps mercedesae]|uniref:Uncharacterized protein n=1 Tax=Tropilaelaps mercedesae TaxID=418985 RepID=A0A1V9XLE1_9ACAR|nr:hypothetical protein BIW11_09156 [Tropilaelaps mercedesae]
MIAELTFTPLFTQRPVVLCYDDHEFTVWPLTQWDPWLSIHHPGPPMAVFGHHAHSHMQERDRQFLPGKIPRATAVQAAGRHQLCSFLVTCNGDERFPHKQPPPGGNAEEDLIPQVPTVRGLATIAEYNCFDVHRPWILWRESTETNAAADIAEAAEEHIGHTVGEDLTAQKVEKPDAHQAESHPPTLTNQTTDPLETFSTK